MNNFIIIKYKKIVETLDTISTNISESNICFKSYDEYNSLNSSSIDNEIKNNILNNKIKCGTIINIHKIFSIEEISDQKTINYNNINIELNINDLIVVNNNYYFVITIQSNNSVIVQPIIEDSKILKDDILYKISNCSKYNTIYTSLHKLNKKCTLRNLLIPSLNLTKLINNKVNSDFWNNEQKNAICNINKITENKKIHVINGNTNTGKSTVLLGLLANSFNKDVNIKQTIISPFKINHLLDKLISQQNILFNDNNPLIILVGDINDYNEKYDQLHISKYINTYKQLIPEIISDLKNQNITELLLSNIIIKIEQLVIEPYSYKNELIIDLFKNIEMDISYKDYIISILLKWTNDIYIKTMLLKKCNILISTLNNDIDISEYDTNILIVDDAEIVPEINIIEYMKDSVNQVLLIGNNNNTCCDKSCFNRMILGGVNSHNLVNIY